MRNLCSAIVLAVFGVSVSAQDAATAKAKAGAALALAKIRRDAAGPVKTDAKGMAAIALEKCQKAREAKAGACMDDLGAAMRLAEKEERRLFVWVGMNCHDAPDVRAAFPGAVHCHVDALNDSATPRLLVGPTSGTPMKGLFEPIPRNDITPVRVQRALELKKISAIVPSVTSINC